MDRTNTVLAALAFLSSVCDGASSDDRAGFSGADVEFGHDLARKGARYGLSEKQHAAAKKLAWKYRRQLKAAGFDIEQVVVDEWAPAGKPAATGKARPGYVPPDKPVDGFANRYAARCGCGVWVGIEAGRVTKRAGQWITYCAECCEPERRKAAELVAKYGEGNTTQMILMARAITEDRTMSPASRADAVAFLAEHGEPVVHLRVVGPNGEALA